MIQRKRNWRRKRDDRNFCHAPLHIRMREKEARIRKVKRKRKKKMSRGRRGRRRGDFSSFLPPIRVPMHVCKKRRRGRRAGELGERRDERAGKCKVSTAHLVLQLTRMHVALTCNVCLLATWGRRKGEEKER